MYEIFEQLCQLRGVTAFRVSKETGISQPTFSEWKKGTYTPKTEKMQKIADYFNVPLEYLTTGKMPENEKGPENNSESEKAFFRLRKGLEPYNLDEEDTDFLLTVFKAHKEKNK